MFRYAVQSVCLLAALALGASLVLAEAPAPAPAGEPAPALEREPAPAPPAPPIQPQPGEPIPFDQPQPPQVSPEAQEEIDRIGQAYAELQSLELAGSIQADFDIAGQKQDHRAEFESAFQVPNKFRHRMEDDIELGSTGELLYAYQPEHNRYVTGEAPDQRVPPQLLPQPIPQILQMQNPGLLLALTPNAADQLMQGVTRVEKRPDVEIDDRPHTALQFSTPNGELNLFLDPETHLVRRILVDLTSVFEAQGQPDVNAAELVFDYTTLEANGDMPDDRFAWSPPEGAMDAAPPAPQPGQPQGQIENGPQGLIGEPAPDFALANLDGEQVRLADLRGSVVVLDFWATWCAPCIMSMPELDAVYREKAEEGLKVFAVNLAEDEQRIRSFLRQHDFAMPTLLDSRGEVTARYGGPPIPLKVVIGRDGVVRNVFEGYSPRTSDPQLRRAVQEALADG